MKKLNAGDIVEIRIDNKWVEYYFVCEAFQKGEIFVARYEFFYSDELKAEKIPYRCWRIPKQKTYRPFTWEGRDQLRGKWIRNKETTVELLISQFWDKNKSCWVGLGTTSISPRNLLDNFTFLDGLPCGLEE